MTPTVPDRSRPFPERSRRDLLPTVPDRPLKGAVTGNSHRGPSGDQKGPTVPTNQERSDLTIYEDTVGRIPAIDELVRRRGLAGVARCRRILDSTRVDPIDASAGGSSDSSTPGVKGVDRADGLRDGVDGVR